MALITDTSNPISVLNHAWDHARQSLFEVDDTVDLKTQGEAVATVYMIIEAAKHLVDTEEKMERALGRLGKKFTY